MSDIKPFLSNITTKIDRSIRPPRLAFVVKESIQYRSEFTFQVFETHLLLPRSWDQIRGVRYTAHDEKKDCFALGLSLKPSYWVADSRRDPMSEA